MKDFMSEDFLLNSKTAERLYFEYAEAMPIFDYHCHLNPEEIALDRQFKNITEIWLKGDHYKWRQMRVSGVDERFITGDASDKEKFMQYAEILPYCMGNPIYHWTHLELKRYFNINKPLTPATADEIYEKCNALLAQKSYSCREIIRKSNVKVICTTDDPADDLRWHSEILKIRDFKTVVASSFRPDKGINIERPGFADWVKKLQDISGIEISSYDGFVQALESRVDFFHAAGCRVSDHALDSVPYRKASEKQIADIFLKGMNDEKLTYEETEAYKTDVLLKLAALYQSKGWVMQFHIGVMRNVNQSMFEKLGPDTGFDAIDDANFALPLASLLNSIEADCGLPKTILYTINSTKNEVLGTLVGAFCRSIPGKIQFGTAWWFNDHIRGMESQMKSLGELGVLGRFVGMLTDSRSFLSYTRHEYFRRILCNMIGSWIERGELHNDIAFYGKLVQDISFNNAAAYFPIEIK